MEHPWTSIDPTLGCLVTSTFHCALTVTCNAKDGLGIYMLGSPESNSKIYWKGKMGNWWTGGQ